MFLIGSVPVLVSAWPSARGSLLSAQNKQMFCEPRAWASANERPAQWDYGQLEDAGKIPNILSTENNLHNIKYIVVHIWVSLRFIA